MKIQITRTIEVGDVGVIVVTGALGNGLYMSNDVGGTGELPPGRYRVEVTKTWHDYETGNRCHGKLLDPEAVAIARKAGTTGYRDRKTNPPVFDPSKVYFNADQLVIEPVKRQKKNPPAPGYSLKGIKLFKGMDGLGLNATLLRDGKAVCDLVDEGCGGMLYFRWLDRKGGVSAEETLWDAFIASEKEKKDDVKKDEMGHTERYWFDGEMWVNQEVDRLETAKRLRKLCKTHTVFQVGAGIGGEKILTVKETGPAVRAWIEKKYAGKKVKFLTADAD
jgi:hypothetical protein